MANKKNRSENQSSRESDSKNRTEMLNKSQIDEVVKNPPRKDKKPEKKDGIL